MTKKIIAIMLVSVLLLLFSGSIFAMGSGRVQRYGPIIQRGDPWGEYRSINNPPTCNRPNLTSGYGDSFPTQAFTNFVMEFYLRYVMKQRTQEQNYNRMHDKSQ